jgi:DNA repair photolyase
MEPKKSGAREWSEHSFNIQRGCPNKCHYCYARGIALRYGSITKPEQWGKEILTKKSEKKSFTLADGVIMMPTTHDVTPFNVAAFKRIALLAVEAGNQILIVSKPRMVCIQELCEALTPYKDQVEFRFSIGTLDPTTAAFWEPGAPKPEERIFCLMYASAEGFKTSVSMEPMLMSCQESFEMIGFFANHPAKVDTVWVGKMISGTCRQKWQERQTGSPRNSGTK